MLDFPPQPSESAGLLGFLQEPEADVVVMVGYGEAQAALFAAAAERALVPRAPVIGFLGGISTSDRFGPAALRGAEGVVELTVAPDPAKEGTAALRESFALWNIPLSLDAYLAHESVMLLADALERAATTDRSAVLEALAAGAWDSASLPFGPTAFAAGRNDSAVPQGFQLRKGVLVPIGTDACGLLPAHLSRMRASWSRGETSCEVPVTAGQVSNRPHREGPPVGSGRCRSPAIGRRRGSGRPKSVSLYQSSFDRSASHIIPTQECLGRSHVSPELLLRL